MKGLRTRVKEAAELRFWRARKRDEGTLENDHFLALFTEPFGIAADFFEDARMLDVGCGPRGSLEWALSARERVGADPLAGSYRKLGTDAHAMRYIETGAESLPFEDAHFDVVSCLNSLDHVDDLDRAVAEITRVTRPGGSLLLIVEVGHSPTWTEPQALQPEFAERLQGWRLVTQTLCAKADDIYGSIQAGSSYNGGAGVLAARLERATA